MDGELPKFLMDVMGKYPGVWEAYQDLGAAVGGVSGLDAKTQEIVKLGIAIGVGSEGAVHSHARRCRDAGFTDEEIIHAALLSVTTMGWPQAVASLSWIDDILGKIRSGK
jgi:alkylhydroperoxidase/carboxymuconolactone decarboxylase family protein YurZ